MGMSKAMKRDKKSQLIQGLKKHFGKVKTITLKGKPVKLAGLLTQLQTSIATGLDTDAKRAVYLDAAKESRAADEAVDPTVLILTDYLQSTMSAANLADFGIKAKVRAVPDVATKAAAIEKRAATREARGTRSRKEKLKIVGVVAPAAPPVPVAAGSSPAIANGAAAKTTASS